MVLRVDFYPAVISGDPQVWILFMGLGVAPMVGVGWEGRVLVAGALQEGSQIAVSSPRDVSPRIYSRGSSSPVVCWAVDRGTPGLPLALPLSVQPWKDE